MSPSFHFLTAANLLLYMKRYPLFHHNKSQATSYNLDLSESTFNKSTDSKVKPSYKITANTRKLLLASFYFFFFFTDEETKAQRD